MMNFGPGWLRHRRPVTISFQSPLEQPIGFALFSGDKRNSIFVKSGRGGIGFDVRVKAVFIFFFYKAFDGFGCGAHKNQKD
jgi:hypothetical protein